MLTNEQTDRVDNVLRHEEDLDVIEHELNDLQSSEELFYCVENYNWDNGFVVPNIIADHPKCDLAIALALFWLSDAISCYQMNIEPTKSNQSWLNFSQKLTDRILNDYYKIGPNKYEPELTKVQAYKMKNQGVPEVFITAVESK